MPENRDLSDVVTNLNRVKAASRAQLANDNVTRAFLDAALHLTQDLFADRTGEPLDPEDDVRPTLSYLSKPQVVKRARQDFAGLNPTDGKFRDRWASQSAFLADFTSYALTDRHWSLHLALSRNAESLLVDGDAGTLPTAVHRVAFEDLKLVMALPAYRFQLLAVASAQADSVAARGLVRMYATLSEAWCSLYGKVFQKYGISFRRGLTLDDFNIILQATAEGLGLRLLAGTGEPIINDSEKTSLLGTAALALFVSFIDLGDGLSLEELTQHYLTSLTGD